jgi:hypothetical protein
MDPPETVRFPKARASVLSYPLHGVGHAFVHRHFFRRTSTGICILLSQVWLSLYLFVSLQP